MSCVYKIICGNDFYIGSTKNLKNRLNVHKSKSKRVGDIAYNYLIYTKIRDVGFDNIIVEIIETCSDYLTREQHYITTLKPTLNMINAVQSPTYFKDWDTGNDCVCGGKFTNSHKNEHINSKKHKLYLGL
jgi:group I intron endonuclease